MAKDVISTIANPFKKPLDIDICLAGQCNAIDSWQLTRRVK